MNAIAKAEALRSSIRRLEGVSCFGRERVSQPGVVDLDATRVTLDVSQTGISGFDFARRLNEEHIYPEMATLQHVLFLVT
jgi:arginine/lysine/ornithine decarboxylase